MPPFNLILPFFFCQAMLTAMATAPMYAMQMAVAFVPTPVATASK